MRLRRKNQKDLAETVSEVDPLKTKTAIVVGSLLTLATALVPWYLHNQNMRDRLGKDAEYCAHAMHIAHQDPNIEFDPKIQRGLYDDTMTCEKIIAKYLKTFEK